jgi:two-component system phosphate regulon response regulator OmpR
MPQKGDFPAGFTAGLAASLRNDKPNLRNGQPEPSCSRFDFPEGQLVNGKLIPHDDAPHILVVDDDRRIRTLLSRYLGDNSFRVTEAADAQEAGRKLSGMSFDLVVLDVMMPGQNGMDFCTELRESDNSTPVLMLTALGEVDDRVKGLSAGADDFLPKPFDPRELLLRVKNILRRGGPIETPKIEQIVFGPYTYYLAKQQLRAGTQAIRLTDREQEMLTLFAERAGETVPRHELLNDESATGERTVDVQINRLRRKIEVDPANPVWLQTVRGIGYKLNVE